MKLRSLNKAILTLAMGTTMCGMASLAEAAVTDLPFITVKGEKCYYYDVLPKESIYQVANKLGITRDRLVQFNPSAADGLKPRMRLFFPVKDFADQEPGNRKAVYAHAAGIKEHVVKKGETLYGIARQYGMSPDLLAHLNPSAADGLRTGDVLRITSEDTDSSGDTTYSPAANTAGADGIVHHTIQKGETLFGIANAYNVPLETMLEANPSIDPLKYKPGQIINIPTAATPTDDPVADSASDDTHNLAADRENATHIEAPEVDTQEMPFTAYTDADEETMDQSAQELSDTLNVAVMLPFMLDESTMTRTTQLYTEFFKGMLMGADDMLSKDGAHIRFHFFDTASSLDTVRSLLQKPVMEEIDLVVAPDNTQQLDAIVESVEEDVPVLNIFAVKDESYRSHRNMIQTNIPHDAMYAKAIDMFLEKYSGTLPVFLSRTEGMADKESFTSALKKRLDEEGRDFREVTFVTSLTDGDLEGIDPATKPVVFIPNSGSRNEFAKFIGAIKFMHDTAADPNRVTIFGYPEWVTFRGDSFNDICDLNATIYSRFMASDTDADTKRLKQRYKDLYGCEMFEAVPAQGILGYDIATFIIKGLREKEETGVFPPEFDGVQSYWRLGWSGVTENNETTGESTSNGGLVNEALYFINYLPGGTMEWKK